MKRCSCCSEEKPTSDFPRDRGSRDGYYAWCKTCSRQKSKARYHADPERARSEAKAWKLANPEKVRAQQRSHYAKNREVYAGYMAKYKARDPEAWARKEKNWKLRHDHGITLEEYEVMLDEQGGICPLCSSPPGKGKWLVVDHNHTTGKVRGLLCSPCNVTLHSHLDDTQWFVRAAFYMEERN